MTDDRPEVAVAGRDGDAGEALARLLEVAGFWVRRLDADGARALAGSPGPAALVLDLERPNDNLRVLEGLRADGAALVVAVVGASELNARFARESGADVVVRRPFHLDDLADALRAAIAGAP